MMGNREEEIPKWRLVYEVLRTVPVGETLDYQAIADCLGVDPVRDRKKCQTAIARAREEFIRSEKHAVEPVRHVGYRVAEPNQHHMISKQHRRKSVKALEKGHTVGVNTDFNKLNKQERKDLELEIQRTQRQLDFVARDEERRAKIASGLQVTQVAVPDKERAAAKAKVAQAQLDPAT